MKRWIALLFTLALAFSLGGCQKPMSMRLYAPVVEKALEDKWANGVGALYDLDGDGGKELIMQHTVTKTIDADGQPHEAPMVVLSVYTLAGTGVKARIEERDLYIEVGGNGGYLSVMERDGKRYLSVFLSGEGDKGCDSVVETRMIYRISEYYAENCDGGTYIYEFDENGSHIHQQYKLASTPVTQEEYEAWEAGYTEVFRINPYTYNDPELGNPEVRSLEDLLTYLEEIK